MGGREGGREEGWLCPRGFKTTASLWVFSTNTLTHDKQGRSQWSYYLLLLPLPCHAIIIFRANISTFGENATTQKHTVLGVEITINMITVMRFVIEFVIINIGSLQLLGLVSKFVFYGFPLSSIASTSVGQTVKNALTLTYQSQQLQISNINNTKWYDKSHHCNHVDCDFYTQHRVLCFSKNRELCWPVTYENDDIMAW